VGTSQEKRPLHLVVEKDNERAQQIGIGQLSTVVVKVERITRSLDPLISDKADFFGQVQNLHLDFGRLKKLIGRGVIKLGACTECNSPVR
jgi:uncharacterized protein (UPF0335 family)